MVLQLGLSEKWILRAHGILVLFQSWSLSSSGEKLWTVEEAVLLQLQDLEIKEMHKIHAFGSVSYSFISYFTCILEKIFFY